MLNVSSNSVSNTSVSNSNGSFDSLRSVDFTGHLVGFIYFIIMAVVTAPANGFLLVTLFRDPLNCFRSAPIILIKSITIANFAIGVLVEPLYAAIYFNIYLGKYNMPYVQLLVKLTGLVSSTVNNTSFLTVGILSLDHLAAVTRPLWYKTNLTKRKRIAYCIAIWIYSAGFSLVSLSGISSAVHHKIDLHLNTTTTLILLLASYVALAVCYRTHQKRRPASSTRAARDKKFFVVICLLVVTASFAGIPTAIALHIYHYCKRCHSRAFYISFEVLQNMFYLKFALDPFLYAWRLRKYRKSLDVVIRGSSEALSLATSRIKNKYEFRPENG